MGRAGRLVAMAGIFLGITFGVPLIERYLACRAPISEACVWAKAYLPLSFGLWAIAGAVVVFVFHVVTRRRPNGA
jgi:hypothetical protein